MEMGNFPEQSPVVGDGKVVAATPIAPENAGSTTPTPPPSSATKSTTTTAAAAAAATTTTTMTSALMLDLPSLEDYLLSLLSNDLSGVTTWLQKSWDQIVVFCKRNDGANRNAAAVNATVAGQTIQSQEVRVGTRLLRRFLALATILAASDVYGARGSTGPAATALGLSVVETDNKKQVRSNENSNVNGTARRRRRYHRRLWLYAFLRIVLPELYAMAKNRTTALTEQVLEPTRITTREQLASHRKRMVLGQLFRVLDGAILPVMRLGLMLSCWSSPLPTHGGNLALWWSGLSYEATPITALAAATTLPSPALHPLFVLYAHRRWLHRTALSLANTTADSLLASYRESTALMRRQVSALLLVGRRRWRWRWGHGFRKKTSVQEDSCSCRICDNPSPAVPYRFGCGHKHCDSNNDNNSNNNSNNNGNNNSNNNINTFVACYTCLWQALASSAVKRNTTTILRCPICYEEISGGSATPI